MAERAHRHRPESPRASAPPAERLHRRIQELATSIHAAQAELVDLLVALDDEDGWCGAGIRSLPHWLTLNCAMTSAEAERLGRATRRRDELPELFAAFSSGSLSVGFLDLAQRHATPATDRRVAEIATTGTAPQAARAFAAFATTDEARGTDADAAGGADGTDHPGPPPTPGADDPGSRDPVDPGLWLSTWWDAHQHLRVDGRLDPTDGATLLALLDRLRDLDHGRTAGDGPTGVPTGDDGAEGDAGDAPTDWPAPGPTPWLTRPEAFSSLLRLAGDALVADGVAGRWTDRFMITVTIDADVLGGARPGNGLLADGTPLAADVVRSWFGASAIEALLTRRGRPLFLGRTARFATPAQRRALLARDGGCAFPGCGRTEHLDAHHVVEWSARGPTDIDHLVLLCRRHHRLHHRGEFTIDVVDGRPVVRSPAIRPDAPPCATSRGTPRRLRTRDGGGCGDGPPPVTRCGEPLTAYGLDVWVASLQDAVARPVRGRSP